MTKLICGVGYNSKREHKVYTGGRNTPAYQKWRNMFSRCYNPKYHEKKPTYIDCMVSENWHDFQDFADWFCSNEFNYSDYELDKDLILPGNKLYSPEYCVLIPRQINSLLNSNKAIRGDLPQGIHWDTRDKKYKVQISINNKRRHLGYFDCPNEAYQAYKKAKEAHVKEKALEWQDRIAENVFQALMDWQLTN